MEMVLTESSAFFLEPSAELTLAGESVSFKSETVLPVELQENNVNKNAETRIKTRERRKIILPL